MHKLFSNSVILKATLFISLLSISCFLKPSIANLNIGDSAFSLDVDYWINSEPISLNNLKGKVVLVRWWTAPNCPFCAASSIALTKWHKTYKDQGLIVIGIYHHKSSAKLLIEQVRHYVKLFNFKFPIAVDLKWKTLKTWWLNSDKRWTSVSFLLDKNGIIRHIHEGGSYVEGENDYINMENKINLLLNEEY